jgi:hypothetical protein
VKTAISRRLVVEKLTIVNDGPPTRRQRSACHEKGR